MYDAPVYTFWTSIIDALNSIIFVVFLCLQIVSCLGLFVSFQCSIVLSLMLMTEL